MRITAITHALPGKRVTNDDIVDAVRYHSAHQHSEGTLSNLIERLRHAFAAAGTEIRYHLAEDEKAIDVLTVAGRKALERAERSAADVDFVIYAGVGRGWIEPAMAGAVQAELGLLNATGFDIIDACASWLRALHVAHTFIRSGTYRCGMIVNCECGSFQTYANLDVRDPAELEYRFASYTIGEAATVTVVTDDTPTDDFYFAFKTFGQYFHLCVIPLPIASRFVAGPIDPRWEPGRFFALSRELFDIATSKIVATFAADPNLRNQSYDIVFGHEASEKVCREALSRLDLPGDWHFSTHRRYGNTVSASVPLSMSVAQEEGRLKRGDRVLVVIGSSGISVGFATFTF